MRFLIILFSTLLFAAFAQAQQITEKRIQFPRGQSGTTLKGTIKGYAIVDYVLGASAGQRMEVELETSNSASYFNVLPADSQAAIFIGSSSGNNFNGLLPQNGDYRIRVYLMRSAARRDETASYTLSIAIHGNGAQQTVPPHPDYADGLSGGPDFWEVRGIAADDRLNIRARPTTRSEILIAVPNGTVLQNRGCEMSEGQRWCRIALAGKDGETGWVAGRYLREAAPPSMTKPGGDDKSATTGSASDEDKAACLEAVRATADNSVTVLSSEFSEANTVVILGVGPNRAPWRCLVSQGEVSEVMSMTDEGAL